MITQAPPVHISQRLGGKSFFRYCKQEKNKEKEGSVLKVLTEGYDDYIKCYFGRSEADAPEIDGKVFFMANKPLKIGEFVNVIINDTIDYDLLGETV